MILEDFLIEVKCFVRLCYVYCFVVGGEFVIGYWYGIDVGVLCIFVECDGVWLNVYFDESGMGGCVEIFM